MDCSLPGSSVHGILQARILEWVAIPFSKGSSQPRDGTCISCIGRQVLYHWATGETQVIFFSSVQFSSVAQSCLTLIFLLGSQFKTCISCISRQVLYHWATGETQVFQFSSVQLLSHVRLWYSYLVSNLKVQWGCKGESLSNPSSPF